MKDAEWTDDLMEQVMHRERVTKPSAVVDWAIGARWALSSDPVKHAILCEVVKVLMSHEATANGWPN